MVVYAYYASPQKAEAGESKFELNQSNIKTLSQNNSNREKIQTQAFRLPNSMKLIPLTEELKSFSSDIE